MKKLTLMTGSEVDFFKRGKRLAKLADAGKQLQEDLVISFEEPAMLLKLLTTARFDLFREIKKRPDSITGIADRLHRDRSAVKRDIDQLAKAGLLMIEDQPLPGHGRMKQVRVTTNQFKLEARLV